MLTHLKHDIKVFAPFVLPQNNWSFDSGKTNGVMPAHVMCHCGAHGVQVYEHRLGNEGKFVQVLDPSNVIGAGNVNSNLN